MTQGTGQVIDVHREHLRARDRHRGPPARSLHSGGYRETRAVVQATEESLIQAQRHAEELFRLVSEEGLIRPGALESEISTEIHALANRKLGLRRHWHKRIVCSGPNSVLSYYADPPDRRVTDDDCVYVDLGPVFGEWEADFGRTYVVGNDPRKHKVVADIRAAFRAGKALYLREPDLTCGALYDFVNGLAIENGWEFGAPTAGHLVGHFPHEHAPGQPGHLSIRHGNDLRLREPDARGQPRHWILEIHFVDRDRAFGGFFEELLTIGPA